jgi:hypothetical protein
VTRRGSKTSVLVRGSRRLGPVVRLVAGGAVAALTLGACGGAVDSGSAAPPPTTRIYPTFPTSLTTASGTWASVPMGHLGHPLNTFWQLFFLPAQGGSWKDHAGQLGIADNGGLLLASPSEESLLVAIRPSHFLKYSALALTTGDGRSWTPVAPIQGTATSLAAGAKGGALAVEQTRSGGKVLMVSPGGSAWHAVLSAPALTSSAGGRACAPIDLSAVGAAGPSGTPLVGATCGHQGVAGVFTENDGRWQSIGPEVDPVGARVKVLSLRTTAGEPSALFSLSGSSGTRIVDGWREASGSWRLSSGLSLGRHGRLVSIGPAPNRGEFVLYRIGSRPERLAVVRAPGVPWTSLPDPPRGTETVAFSSAGRVDALAVDDTVMTDWALTDHASGWAKHQNLRIAIIFGSST